MKGMARTGVRLAFVTACVCSALLADDQPPGRERSILRDLRSDSMKPLATSQAGAGLQDAISDRGIHGRVAGPPCQPFLAFAAEEGARNEPIKREFYVEAAMRGVFLHPNHHWFINMAHTDAVIEESLVAIGAALDAALEKASQGE